MLEAAVALLTFISLGAYFYYLSKIVNKDSAPPAQNRAITKPKELKPKVFNKAVPEVKTELKKPKPTEAKVHYKCVVIKAGSHACQAAQVLANKPILLNEAPTLPLATCDSAQCTCKFNKLEDRRTEDRRAHLKAAREIMGDAHNRRERKDRRKAHV